jgi:FKBP-type peptidyl-prolyl cis-trans isomerase
MRILAKTFAGLALAASMGAVLAPAAVRAEPETTLTADGLKYIDTKPGTGASPKIGQNVAVHYTGWLYVNGAKGKKFDSSRDRGEPIVFPLGNGQVIKGWDEGIETMKVGGKRTLIIPPELGYGARAMGNAIPANSWLIFDVELVGVK